MRGRSAADYAVAHTFKIGQLTPVEWVIDRCQLVWHLQSGRALFDPNDVSRRHEGPRLIADFSLRQSVQAAAPRAIDLAGNEEASETGDHGSGLGADAGVMHVAGWRDESDKSGLPPPTIAIGSRHQWRDGLPGRFGLAANSVTNRR